ncbi:hypothetical protein ACTG16_22575 [Aeromonas sp. 23P]|uniref:hypothetical protein n=1 Tax=Aeromonas sp. 23P TaxID=3452716 RepID=UPI003F79BFBA|nr:hypothetical protein [Aeromonas veronii]
MKRNVGGFMVFPVLKIQWLKERMENVEYALACDDEANVHYKSEPCLWFRWWLSITAFLKIDQW